MTRASGALLACAAALLDQGQIVDRLSRPLTAAALIGLVVYPAAIGPAPAALAVTAILVALTGAVESYLAIRVGFDAALFHRVANAPGAPDFTEIDVALTELGVLPHRKRGRPVEARIRGARRLMRLQLAAFAVQALLAAAGGLAVAWL